MVRTCSCRVISRSASLPAKAKRPRLLAGPAVLGAAPRPDGEGGGGESGGSGAQQEPASEAAGGGRPSLVAYSDSDSD